MHLAGTSLSLFLSFLFEWSGVNAMRFVPWRYNMCAFLSLH
jgi:hypothetical protein